jgi:hypothetical protein
MGVLGEACGRDDINDREELSDRVGTIITWEITLGAVNRKCLAPGLQKIFYPQDTCFPEQKCSREAERDGRGCRTVPDLRRVHPRRRTKH